MKVPAGMVRARRAGAKVASGAFSAALVGSVLIAACGYDWTVIPKRDGGASDAGATCKKNDDCPSNEYCHFDDRVCGKNQFRCGFVGCPIGLVCVEQPTADGVDYRCVEWTCPKVDCSCGAINKECNLLDKCEGDDEKGIVVHCVK